MERPLIKLDQIPERAAARARAAEAICAIDSALDGLDGAERIRCISEVADHLRSLTTTLAGRGHVGADARLHELATDSSPQSLVGDPDFSGPGDATPESIIAW
jgi:hypothetical protein